ncbi:hypothetical protein [Candidatus Trichorickettsia mobilis]|uniref:hypothetical protein n=1 Tax=Candidatus Trichorickettsia mobilis TaxID=1346319 RepID=UPI00292D65D5|nr:hypothetical protein [Candidatus Trichorickettsia mobilis]
MPFYGLLRSSEKGAAQGLIKRWISQNKYLESLVGIYELDASFLKLIYAKAKSTNNFQLLTQILNLKEVSKPFKLEIIEVFTKSKVPLDPGVLYALIKDLDNSHLDKILDNLLCIKELKNDYLYYIEKIAAKRPAIIIPFFQKVFDTDSTITTYDFQEVWAIGECLTESLDNLDLYTDLSPKLFSFLFSIKNKKVQNLLHKLIDTRDKITFIVKLFGWYEKRDLNANNNIEEMLNVVYYLLISNNELSCSIIKELEGMITFVSNSTVGNSVVVKHINPGK